MREQIIFGLATAFAALVISPRLNAQVPAGDDITVAATAGCFSVCEGTTNVKGVQGNVTVTNTTNQAATLTGTVQLQCDAVDVAGASYNLGSFTVSPGTRVLSYSIPFTPVAGCTYSVVSTVTLASGNFSTSSTTFEANCMDQPCATTGCTLTQGYWKNHADKWPVTTLTLGGRTYTQNELLAILRQPVKGNGLISLAHQLIAAKLNVANGAKCTTINRLIADADAMIGSLVVPPSGTGSLSTSSVGSLVTALDNFNNGLIAGCPGHCSE
jgi:hypothetical protein